MKAPSTLQEHNVTERIIEEYRELSSKNSLKTKIKACKEIISDDIINHIFKVFPDSKVISFGMKE
jgi:hypothetical protein